ncbi:class D sortase [Paenibacillus sp. N1-5-1-14]|uniref:class D sortase n=1 Tax=Paenibacillus radicibacter TaxID=2972488 RepID=UPI0021596CF1|nr:class D sortase [Paenibacillus radicibacter]MCR8643606.1 class D sortase [Paenibacillus radicibacter]
MKRRIFSLTLIVIGMVILAYPRLSEIYYEKQQQNLVKEWETSLQNIQVEEDSNFEQPVQTNVTVDSDYSQYKNLDGILVIDKIDLKLPILHGATMENMKTTAASIANTGKVGSIGNYALAGHRNRTFGRNFNRLDELERGDFIKVDVGTQSFRYQVTEIFRVKPEEVWVLEGNGKDKEITLVTCDPIENPTHRLIIKGKMEE